MEWKNTTMQPPETPNNPVDLDFHWDPVAQKISESDIIKYDPSCKRRLEDYFDFLAEFETGQNVIKEPPVIYKNKFSL